MTKPLESALRAVAAMKGGSVIDPAHWPELLEEISKEVSGAAGATPEAPAAPARRFDT